jgi:hypothetical protein
VSRSVAGRGEPARRGGRHGEPARRGGRRLGELALGARLALRGGWARPVLTAVGIGIGVALLLVAASLPAMRHERDARGQARADLVAHDAPASAATLQVASFDTTFGGDDIRGRIVHADGPRAPRPPGVARLPRAGELVVSPALGRLLDSPAGALLRPRLRGHVIGTIGDAGLIGPAEYAFYLGSDRLGDGARRIAAFGSATGREPLSPVLVLLAVIALAALLVPVAAFVAAAMRFGGEARDRRLAALRLVGADRGMARRIAAGEALLGAAAGLVLGAVVFVAMRAAIPHVTLWSLSVFAADVRPSPVLAALVAVAVPAAAVAVTLVALRGAVAEPLGVTRRVAGARRRLWWRLVAPAFSLLILYPLVGHGGGANEYRVAFAVVLALVGAAALLPWLIETVVRRLDGGGLAWQLAVRRLQLDSGTSARVVSGVTVAVAGAIALQTVFSGVQGRFTRSTGQDPARAQAQVFLSGAHADTLAARLRATPGVRAVTALTEGEAHGASVMVGDCASLRELAAIGHCADGDAFVVGPAVPGFRQAQAVTGRADPGGIRREGVLATPSAFAVAKLSEPGSELYLSLDPARPDAIERVRDAAAAVDPTTNVTVLRATTTGPQFANLRRALFAGVIAVLVLIGASLLVTALEQVRERRRLLAVLVAVGARRSTVSWSVLWQTALPMALGLLLAVAAGIGLGALLLGIVGTPVRFDWASVAGMTAAGGAVVLAVTALSLPPLWRLMRPEGLRTE